MQRRVYSLVTFLEDMGGFYDAVAILGLFFNALVARKLLVLQKIQSVFYVKLNPDNKRVDFSTEEKKNEWLKQARKLKLSVK